MKFPKVVVCTFRMVYLEVQIDWSPGGRVGAIGVCEGTPPMGNPVVTDDF